MLQLTEELKHPFDEAIKDDHRKVAYRIKIDNQVVLLNQLMSKMTITTDGGFEEYHVGYALTSSLDFSTKKELELTPFSYVDIEVGLEVEQGDGFEMVYLPFQRFYLYDSEMKGMERRVKCYDYMYQLASKGYFPSAKHRTTLAVCQDMSQQLGIEFKGVQNVSIDAEELEGRTYKETLGYLASAMGCNVRIARDHKIEFFGLTTTNLTFSPREYKTPTTNESIYLITCLEVHYGEKKTGENGEVLDEGYYRVGEYTTKAGLLTLSNPLLKNQKEVALRVLNKLKELRYARFETSIPLADYRLEVGDMVSFQLGESNVTVPLLYTQYTLVYDHVILSLKSPTKSQEKKEYSFQGTLTQKVNAVYTDLIQVKTLIADKISVEQLEVEFAKIEKLYVKEAEINQLVAGSIAVQDLQANIANLNVLVAGKADISELNAAVANIHILNADLGVIKNLVNGNLSSENIQAGGITSDKLTIANGFIKDAMIDSLNANKIKAGQIDTTLVHVTSSSGNLVIQDNTIQISDANRVRVQIGKDASNDYSMSVWDSNGQLMFDARGLKAEAIKDSIIRNEMISAGANIDGSKLNISSVVSEMNEGSTTLKASKVQIDGVAQTLEVAFNLLKTQADGTKSQTESHTTAINVAQGQINTLIQDTTITKDGQTVKLKDEYSKLEQTVGSLSSTIGKQQTTIDDHTGKITATNSEMVSLKQNLNGLSASISTAQTMLESQAQLITGKANASEVYVKTEVYTKGQTDSAINLAKDSINLGISQTYETKTNVETKITSAVNNIEIGGRNLLKGTYATFKEVTFGGWDYYFPNRLTAWVPNQKLTGRIYIKPTNQDASCMIHVRYKDSTYSQYRGNVIKAGVEGYSQVTITVPNRTDISHIEFSIRHLASSTPSDRVMYKEAKVEPGTKATAWTPAPEDVDSAIDKAKTDAIDSASTDATNKVNSAKSELNTAINKKANSTDVYTKIETYTKAETDSKIKVAKDEINLSVSSTYETKVDVTAKLNGVNASISTLQQRVSTAESKITDTAIINTVKKNFYTKEETNTQITSKGYQTASQVQQLVDQVAFNFNQSGGYNLLLNSRWENDFFNWNPHSNCSRILDAKTDLYYIRIPMVVGSNQGMAQSFKVEKGRTYTVSARVDVDAGAIAGVEISYTDASGTKKWLGANTTSATNYQNGVLFFTWTPDISCETGVNFYARGNHGSGVTAGAYVRWRYTQIEQGSTHTGWSPNPYEIYQGQTWINKNGVRVNASNVGTYTEMAASGFFVKYNNGNKLFEASNCIKLYDNNNVSAIEVLINPSAAYGNAMINVRGGINFLHKPGQSTGTNGIQLGNHDASHQYGMHNLSIRCHNSLGFADNHNLTNMFLDVRRGRLIMKGALYQNTQTPPATFSMNFDGEDEVYSSGYSREGTIEAIMELKTGVYVDNEGECCSAIYGGYSELLTTEYTDEYGEVTTHLNHEALNASLVVMCQEQQKVIYELKYELNEIKKSLTIA